MSRRGLWLCGVMYLIGVGWRCFYIVFFHPPEDYVYSDMSMYTAAAVRFFDPAYVPTIADTYQAPGTAFYLGFLRHLGGGAWGLATVAQLGLSCAVPLVVGAIALELYEIRAAAIAVAIASVYYPFVDYFAYFLSEGPFLFCLTAWTWLLLRSLRARERGGLLSFGIAGGVFLGLAVACKGQGLLAGGFTLAGLGIAAARRKDTQPLAVATASVLGFLLVVGPLTLRTTRLNEGRFAFVSTAAAANVLMGHYGDVRLFHFDDPARNLNFEFGNPVSTQRGLTDEVHLPFGVFDSAKNLEYAAAWVAQHPADAVLLSLRSVSDLFEGTLPWPTAATEQSRWMRLSEMLFKIAILFPACLYLATRPRRREGSWEWVVVTPIVGLLVTTFLTTGEPRYRIPFDAYFIVLAAAWYASRPSIGSITSITESRTASR